MICKNCGEEVSGKFCSHCGQDAGVSKITFAKLTNELSESVLQVNKGFFFTMKELITRPGYTIREYLDGKRKKHYKPLTYILLLSTIYFLLTKSVGQNTWISDAIIGFTQGAEDTASGLEVSPVALWLSRNYAYTTLLLLPFFSLASYLSFRKSGANYFEHIVLNSYLTGQQALIYLIFGLLFSIVKPGPMESAALFSSIGYGIWAYTQFFDHKRTFVVVLLCLLTYAIYNIFCLFLLGGVVSVGNAVGLG